MLGTKRTWVHTHTNTQRNSAAMRPNICTSISTEMTSWKVAFARSISTLLKLGRLIKEWYIYISASKLNLKAVDRILLIMSYGFGDVCALSTQIVHLWIILYTIYQHMHTNTLSAICNVQTHEWLLQPSQTNISWITLVSVFSWFTYTLSTIFLTVFFWCSFESNQGATLVLLSDALQLAALSAESAHGGLKPCRAWTVEVCKQLFGEWGMVPINSILDVCIYNGYNVCVYIHIYKCIYIYNTYIFIYNIKYI